MNVFFKGARLSPSLESPRGLVVEDLPLHQRGVQ